jgi:hypothetical protein
MAVAYKDIKAKVETTEFTKEELKAIDHVESFIDKKINESFDNSPIYFDINTINFTCVPDRGGYADFKATRRRIMREEIDKRFTVAGWSISVDYDNLHWIIQGK